jgi:hypothetical protein
VSQITTIEYNGLELGLVDSGYGISEIDGLTAPPISTSEQQKTEGQGSNIFAQKYNSRILQFRVEVMATTVDQYLQYAREFVRKYKINVDDFLTITMWNGDVRKIKAVVTDGPTAKYKPDNVTMNVFKLEMTAENPFFLDNTTKTYQTGLPVKGGFPIPAPVPFPLGAPSGGQFTISNDGDDASFAEFFIYGPVVNPTIRNATTGEEFQILNTIPDGSYVRVFRDQEGVFVYLNGSTNWRRYLIGDLFAIELGNNLIRWNASVFEADAILAANFNDAYLSA